MSPSDTTMPVWDRRTLLELSQSPLVSPPSNMKPLDEWYGVGASLAGTWLVLYRSRRHNGADDGGKWPAQAETSRRAPNKGPTAMLGPVARQRARHGEEADADALAWRRVQEPDRPRRDGAPAWLQDDGAAPRTAKAGVDSIEAFKAQMREKERRERGNASAAAPQPPKPEASMYDDLAPSDDVSERSSRFARFFDTKAEPKKTSGTDVPSVSSLDLLGLFQGVQKRDEAPAAPSPTLARAAPSVASMMNAPAAPESRVGGATPSQAGSEAPSRSAPVVPPTTTTEGMPSAADMASMQVLMAKLMGSRPAQGTPATPGTPGTPRRDAPSAPSPGRAPRPPGAVPAPPGLAPHAHAAASPKPPGLAAPGTGTAVPPSAPPGLTPAVPPAAPMTSLGLLQSLMKQHAPPTPSTAATPPPMSPATGHERYAPPPPPPGLFPPNAPPPPWAVRPMGIDPRHAPPGPPPPGLGGPAPPPGALPPWMAPRPPTAE